MKVRIKPLRLLIDDQPKAAVGVMCGERWYALRSWKAYPFIWKPKKTRGLGIGPILFWKGN